MDAQEPDDTYSETSDWGRRWIASTIDYTIFRTTADGTIAKARDCISGPRFVRLSAMRMIVQPR